MGMGIDKTLDTVKQLKNHYKVFAELEEFLQSAVTLQKETKELEAQKVGLQEDIKELEEEKVALDLAFKELRRKKDNEMSTLVDGMNEELQERRKVVFADVAKCEAQKKKAESELGEAEAAHEESQQRIQQETAEAEATLRTTERKLQAIKAKLE